MSYQTRTEMMSLPYVDKETGTRRHRFFYGQLVNDATISHVVAKIGADVLASSSYALDAETGDAFLNDINSQGRFGGHSLVNWDRAGMNVPKACSFLHVGITSHSFNDLVCITKEAARQHIDRTRTVEWCDRCGNAGHDELACWDDLDDD
jgi:hypothetical protein